MTFEKQRTPSIYTVNPSFIINRIQQELHCLNSEFAFSISDVLVKKCLQNKSWSACANELGLSGRKQIEQAIRHDLSFILDNLHCKTAESD